MRRFGIITVSLVFLTTSVIGSDEQLAAICRKLADTAAADQSSVIKGRDDWLFFLPELRHLGVGSFWGEAAETASQATRADARDPLPAILDFHRQLESRNVKLIFAPVPPKVVVHSQNLPNLAAPFASRMDPYHQAFYEILRGEGVTVLDLTEHFLSAGEKEHGALYCRQDTHWSGAGCVEAAKQIASVVAPIIGHVERTEFDTEWRTIEISGDLWRMLEDPALSKEELAVRTVKDATPDPESPVILLGDSHALVFHGGDDMHYRNAGLADQLAVELGMPVDLIGVRGSGATPARVNLFRRAQRDASYWDNKKVVIWVFAAREFTESDGWRVLPIAP